MTKPSIFRISALFIVLLIARNMKNALLASFYADKTMIDTQIASETKQATLSASTPTSLLSPDAISLKKAVQEVTSYIYRESPDLNRWLKADLPKIFVYDTLPQNWSNITLISKCIEEKLLGFDDSHNGTCLWEPNVCDDPRNPPAADEKLEVFMNFRANYNTDVGYQTWFQRYPYRTTNSSEADIFVVPYPHWSHCLCHRDMSKLHRPLCKILGKQVFKTQILDHLIHYAEKPERHLFLFAVDWPMIRSGIRNRLSESSMMVITLGPTDTCDKNELCRHFVTPYMDSSAARQPQVIQALPDTWWTNRIRKYSVGAVMGSRDSFLLRKELMRTIKDGDRIGSLPVRLENLGTRRRQLRQEEIRKVYNESIFCPILPGDNCPQKRFFDVIMDGCIPVVPKFTPSDEEGYPTFYNYRDRCSIRKTYPFSRGTFFSDDKAGIDYESLVVTFDGFCGIKCMTENIERTLTNATDLKRLRTKLKDYAKIIAFGLDDNMYQSPDSFSAMLVAMRHYVFHMENGGDNFTRRNTDFYLNWDVRRRRKGDKVNKTSDAILINGL